MTNVMTKTKDIYDMVVELIEEGNLNEAIEIVRQIKDRSSRVVLLRKLTVDVHHNIQSFLDQINEKSPPQVRRTRELVQALSYELNRSGDFTFTTSRNLAYDIGGELQFTFAKYFHNRFIEDISRAIRFNFIVFRVLDKELSESALTDDYIVVSNIEAINPNTLSTQIVPFLEALFALQAIIDQLNNNKPTATPKIISISQNSDATFRIRGIPDAGRIFKEIIAPWIGKNARLIARLKIFQKQEELASLQVGIASLQVKVEEIDSNSVLEAKEAVEGELFEAPMPQGFQTNSEIHEIKRYIYKETFDMAAALVDESAPNLSEDERLNYIIQIINQFNDINNSLV